MGAAASSSSTSARGNGIPAEVLGLHGLDASVFGDASALASVPVMPPPRMPVVYRAEYNVRFLGLEKLHPFDSCKYAKVVARLERAGCVRGGEDGCYRPGRASRAYLEDVHAREYLDSLRSSWTVARVTELAPLCILPGALTSRYLLRNMQFQVSGTLVACALALACASRVAVNVGGGMHHAHGLDGGGWCVYADIMLAIRALRRSRGGRLRVMVVDTDAHQGNGVERDVMRLGDRDTWVLDVYNRANYPGDQAARGGIGTDVPLKPYTGDAEYLARLREALAAATSAFGAPDLVIHNAGTDVLRTDPLGALRVSADGILQRDATVVTFFLARGVPVAHLLSGGYAPESADVIADSIIHLHGLVDHPPPAPPSP